MPDTDVPDRDHHLRARLPRRRSRVCSQVDARRRDADTLDLVELLERHARRSAAGPRRLGPDDIAFLTYTSGTTGPAEGRDEQPRATSCSTPRCYRDWIGLDDDDVVFGVAPFFHITGLIGHLAVALLAGMPLVISIASMPTSSLELDRAPRRDLHVGSITVFIALMNAPTADRRDLSSLTKICSGGAPIAPATVEALERKFGAYIHNIYGLTETTSPSHCVPFGRRAPVDPESGALSVGVPVFNTLVRVVDDAGNDVPAGEIGEFVTSGPQVVSGYWNQPEETEHAIPGGALRTGDVGLMDEDGWFYLVDRKKDQINVSGYKVWPRDVEDACTATGGARGRGRRCPRRVPRRDRQGLRLPQAWRAVTADELIAYSKRADGGLQVPASDRVRRRAPEDRQRQVLRRSCATAEPFSPRAGSI